jgi:2'-5' RNA ligase
VESFFQTVPAARWPRPNGRLHVYLLPDGATADYAEGYQQAVAAAGVAGLAFQPREWLHMTVQMLDRYIDDLTQEQLGALSSELRARLAGVAPFDLSVGPALVSSTSITLDATPDEPWRQLCQAVRAAAVASIGEDAVAPQSGHGRPHVTLAYATEHVDADKLYGPLNHHRAGRVTLRAGHAPLLAVHQDLARGVFTWDTIDTIPLGGMSSGAGTASRVSNVVAAGAQVGKVWQGGDNHGVINL